MRHFLQLAIFCGLLAACGSTSSEDSNSSPAGVEEIDIGEGLNVMSGNGVVGRVDSLWLHGNKVIAKGWACEQGNNGNYLNIVLNVFTRKNGRIGLGERRTVMIGQSETTASNGAFGYADAIGIRNICGVHAENRRFYVEAPITGTVLSGISASVAAYRQPWRGLFLKQQTLVR